MNTHHRCLHPEKSGLLVIEVIGTVCGKAVCGPCNYDHGNEGLFRCPKHSVTDDDSSTDSFVQEGRGKENVAVISRNVQKHQAATKIPPKKNIKIGKGNEYTAKDLLILSQAYIRTSENAIDGTSKRQSKFWDEVSVAFAHIKKQQEAYDARHSKRQKYNAVSLGSDFSSDTDVDGDDEAVIIQKRTPSPLQQKWSKFLLPLVTKFITLTIRNPKRSGEGM